MTTHSRLILQIQSHVRTCLLPGLLWIPLAGLAQPDQPPQALSAQRQNTLIHVVRQDCGSCHGMRLKGGLGPALTADALSDRPLESLVATILHGRPGTPMPGWKGMLDEADALWIAQQLQRGFPESTQP